MNALCNMPFTILTDEEEKELHRLSQFYWKEALRCEQSKAYLAGCVTRKRASPVSKSKQH
jgi:hypothetical protein